VSEENPKTTLTDGSPVTPDHREIDPATGMQKGYVVLSEEERAKGFVRPVRRSYKHVGARPVYPTRELTDEERKLFGAEFVVFEEYPPEKCPATGRFWKKSELNSGCGTVTTMSQPLAETYARSPAFYSGTYCSGCRNHFPVGADGEFVWVDDGTRVGT
jgi:hypothetical protein